MIFKYSEETNDKGTFTFQKNKKFINLDSNRSKHIEQKGGTCYAYSAVSAYINAVAKNEPEFKLDYKEAVNVALNDKHEVCVSIKKLEEKYNKCVKCEYKKYPINIKNIYQKTIIIAANFSGQEMKQMKKYGKINDHDNQFYTEFIEKYQRTFYINHAMVVESYNFENGKVRCKNSWKFKRNNGRVDIDLKKLDIYEISEIWQHVQKNNNKKYDTGLLSVDENQAYFNPHIVCHDRLPNGKWACTDIDDWIKNKTSGTYFI